MHINSSMIYELENLGEVRLKLLFELIRLLGDKIFLCKNSKLLNLFLHAIKINNTNSKKIINHKE